MNDFMFIVFCIEILVSKRCKPCQQHLNWVCTVYVPKREFQSIVVLSHPSDTTAPTNLKLLMVPSFCPFTLISLLFCGAHSGSETSLFFSNYLFTLGFKLVQDDCQHDFARMIDKVNSSVVLAELLVALFRECNNQQ